MHTASRELSLAESDFQRNLNMFTTKIKQLSLAYAMPLKLGIFIAAERMQSQLGFANWVLVVLVLFTTNFAV